MKEYSYSKFSLVPIDKEERQRFMKFRNDDVHQMFIYPCVIGSLGLVLGLIALFFL